MFIVKETGESFLTTEAINRDFKEGGLLSEGRIPDEYLPIRQGLRDAVYGAAVGDALGVPFEFKQRDTFECVDMVGYGAHHMPAGTFSDDTSMMLAICDSIRERGGKIDVGDMRKRFVDWYRKGAYTVGGACFDIDKEVGRDAYVRDIHAVRGCRAPGDFETYVWVDEENTWALYESDDDDDEGPSWPPMQLILGGKDE